MFSSAERRAAAEQKGSSVAESQSALRGDWRLRRSGEPNSWKLRATMSLARLLAKQRRRDEACAKLAEIYGWFPEGFDTPDLKEAKTLLGELSD
jgi:predicted ATPase